MTEELIEAQDLQIPEKINLPELKVRVQLGMQVLRTRTSNSRTSICPFWNEDLIFVAAEPFEEQLVLLVEDRPSSGSNKDVEALGQTRIALNTIERRLDYSMVSSRWFNLEKVNGEPSVKYHGRIHLRLCFDGGYHVMDEAAHLSSDLRPTAKQLWKPSIGVLELGILGAKNMLPMKTKGGRGTTDFYCVAKYGQKWVRTRTIIDSFNPKWNEQYTWEIYDPCTVLTLGVFDNWHIYMNNSDKKSSELKDVRIGKVRIRISTLESNRVYTNSYPLLVLQRSGVKKMGEIELSVRFSCSSLLDVVQIYSHGAIDHVTGH
jgi:Ca2+-dependent lipid-binding protein